MCWLWKRNPHELHFRGLKKLELQRAKKRTSTSLKESILTETPTELKWSKKSVLASISAIIFILGLSVGLFLSRARNEGQESQQVSLQKSEIAKPLSQQTKVDIKSQEVPAIFQETPRKQTKNKVASQGKRSSETVIYRYKGKTGIEIPPPF